MRILHVTKKYPNALGGDAFVVLNLERQQKKAGHNISILTSNCPEIVEKENVFKFGLKDSASNQDKITFRRIVSLFILLFSGFRYIKKLRPDVIHSHSADLGFSISFPARFYSIPLVNTCHGVTFPDKNLSLFKRVMEKFFLKYAGFNKIVTVDESTLKYFENEGFSNVIYIPNGVDTELFHPPSERKSKITRFLYVGRLEGQKGIEYLISSTRKLLNRYNTRNLKVLIVGDGSKRQELIDLVGKYKLEGYVGFTGPVCDEKQLAEIYKKSDIFVLPSEHEGFPLTILEAWATRLPVITTDVGGIPDVCVNEENALIIPQRDPEKLAKVMFRLIKHKELKDKLSNNGRRLVEEKYSWEIVSRDVLSMYGDARRL